jgi:hypothetical protein
MSDHLLAVHHRDRNLSHRIVALASHFSGFDAKFKEELRYFGVTLLTYFQDNC